MDFLGDESEQFLNKFFRASQYLSECINPAFSTLLNAFPPSCDAGEVEEEWQKTDSGTSVL